MRDFGFNIPSPLQRLEIVEDYDVFIKRDDLIHSQMGGNKFRKLKYNITHAQSLQKSCLATFGGAFSNHIYATAAVAHHYGFTSIGFIRGEDDTDNPTLRFAREKGMELIFLDRTSYRLKEDAPVVKARLEDQNDYYLIHEGGSNIQALRGVEECYHEIVEQLGKVPDYIVCPVGTGATAAGFLAGMSNTDCKLIAIPVLKHKNIRNDIMKWVNSSLEYNLKLMENYHFGGYARTNEELIRFINEFVTSHSIPLDPIYNGKAMFGLVDLMTNGRLQKGSTIAYVHTGGEQGITGYEYLYPGRLVRQ